MVDVSLPNFEIQTNLEIAILITISSPIKIKKDKNTDLFILKMLIDHFQKTDLVMEIKVDKICESHSRAYILVRKVISEHENTLRMPK